MPVSVKEESQETEKDYAVQVTARFFVINSRLEEGKGEISRWVKKLTQYYCLASSDNVR